MPRSDKIALTSCNIAAMEGIRKCDFRTTGLFSSSFQIHIILALLFWISHVLSDVPVSNFPTPLPQTNAPAPAPLTDSPAKFIHPPETALAPPPAENENSSPPAPPPPPLAIPPALDTFTPGSSPPLSETLTPPSPSVVQEAATNNSWNDSEKAGVIIASIGALLQVFVVAYLLVKRHQMLAMVQDCKQASELMDLVRIIKVIMPICICCVATTSPVQDKYLCRMSIDMVIALKGVGLVNKDSSTQSSGLCLGYYTILYLIQSLQLYSGFKYISTRKIPSLFQSRLQVK